MVASLFGNLAVVVAVLMKRTLRMTVNLYLANLAVADILICICCMWVHLVNHLTAPEYVLGPLWCKFNGFAQSKFFFIYLLYYLLPLSLSLSLSFSLCVSNKFYSFFLSYIFIYSLLLFFTNFSN